MIPAGQITTRVEFYMIKIILPKVHSYDIIRKGMIRKGFRPMFNLIRKVW